PFADRSFDLGLCCEVMEHLPDAVLAGTAAELVRVADRHLVVSVPYRQDLLRGRLKCSSCGTVFNQWGHLRSFDLPSLDRLFPGWTRGETRFQGVRPPYWNPLVVRLRQEVGGRWAEPTPGNRCPRCGNERFAAGPKNLLSAVTSVVNLLTGKLVPRS